MQGCVLVKETGISGGNAIESVDKRISMLRRAQLCICLK